jgi:hypothetical protein
MEEYSDLDTFSESKYKSGQESSTGSDYDDDEPSDNLELELSETLWHEEYNNAPWNPQARLQARLQAYRLAQLHAEIKTRAQLPNPTYEKHSRSWPIRPFDVRILPDYVLLIISMGYGAIHGVYCVYWNVCKEQEAIQEERGLRPLETYYIRDALLIADSIRLKHEALLQTYENRFM